MSVSSAFVSSAATARRAGVADAASFCVNDASAVLPLPSSDTERYCSPAMSAAASPADKRGGVASSTGWVTSTMRSSFSNASQAISNRSLGWYVPVSPGRPELAMRRTARRMSSSLTRKWCAASRTDTSCWSSRYGTSESRKTSRWEALVSGAPSSGGLPSPEPEAVVTSHPLSGMPRAYLHPHPHARPTPPPPHAPQPPQPRREPTLHSLAKFRRRQHPYLGPESGEIIGQHRGIRKVQTNDPGILHRLEGPLRETHLGVTADSNGHLSDILSPNIGQFCQNFVGHTHGRRR